LLVVVIVSIWLECAPMSNKHTEKSKM
jgi:hypothetical protein